MFLFHANGHKKRGNAALQKDARLPAGRMALQQTASKA